MLFILDMEAGDNGEVERVDDDSGREKVDNNESGNSELNNESEDNSEGAGEFSLIFSIPLRRE